MLFSQKNMSYAKKSLVVGGWWVRTRDHSNGGLARCLLGRAPASLHGLTGNSQRHPR
jgi:hypothetical protein